MSKYTFEDLVEVANANPTIFNRFPGTLDGKQLTPPSERLVKLIEKALEVTFPEDYRRVISKWGYLALGKDCGFFGLWGDDPRVFLDQPFNVFQETAIARDSMGLPKNSVVIWSDPGEGVDYGVIDTTTGKVLSYGRYNNNSYVEVSDSFVDCVFQELILHRRANEIVYDTTFQWPESVQEKVAEDMIRLKETLDEYDELFDRFEEMLKNA